MKNRDAGSPNVRVLTGLKCAVVVACVMGVLGNAKRPICLRADRRHAL